MSKNTHVSTLGIFYLLFTFVSCSNQTKVNHLSEFELYGNVKSCKHFDYDVTDDKGVLHKKEDGRKQYLYIFNEKGYIEEKDVIYPEFNRVKKIYYTYDENDLLNTENCHWENVDKNIPYNEEICILDNEEFTRLEGDYRTIYKYNEGEKKEVATYNIEDGTLLKKSVYTNHSSQILKINYYNGGGELSSYDTYEYLDDGVIKTNTFAQSFLGVTDFLICSRYYKNNRLIKWSESVFEGGRGLVQRESEIIYGRNSLVEKTLKGKWVMGYLYRKEHTKGIEDNFEYEYFFDDKGNWVKMIEYKGDARIPVRVEDRVIEYY